MSENKKNLETDRHLETLDDLNTLRKMKADLMQDYTAAPGAESRAACALAFAQVAASIHQLNDRHFLMKEGVRNRVADLEAKETKSIKNKAPALV